LDQLPDELQVQWWTTVTQPGPQKKGWVRHPGFCPVV